MLSMETAGEAALLADMARLTPGPAQLPAQLHELGYQVQMVSQGIRASLDGGQADLTLGALLHGSAKLVVSRRRLIGAQVARSATIVSVLNAVRAAEVHQRPGTLLFLNDVLTDAGDGRNYAIEGGVVPRIWPGCFGSFTLTLRVMGRSAEPGTPGQAINAIEEAIPVLQALARLKGDVLRHAPPRPQTPDSPLSPRLSISAAHGGSAQAGLPPMFDIVVNRRYDPLEDHVVARTEIEQVARAACRAGVEVATSMTAHAPPLPDPEEGLRRPEMEALAVGWGWPQMAFRTVPTLFPTATLVGGLDRSDTNPDSEAAHTTLDAMMALTRVVQHLITYNPPPVTVWTPTPP